MSEATDPKPRRSSSEEALMAALDRVRRLPLGTTAGDRTVHPDREVDWEEVGKAHQGLVDLLAVDALKRRRDLVYVADWKGEVDGRLAALETAPDPAPSAPAWSSIAVVVAFGVLGGWMLALTLVVAWLWAWR